MKKMLLASVFALFGTFAMANEKIDVQSEVRTETTIEVLGCVYVVRTITYNSCGTQIGASSTSYYFEGNGCEGLIMDVNKVNTNAPCGPAEVLVNEF